MLVVAVVLLVIVPARLVRGVAMSMSFFILSFSGNTTAGPEVYQATFVAAIALLVLALLRSRAPKAGGRQFILVVIWWGYTAFGVALMGSYEISSIIVFFGLTVLAAYVVSSLDPAELRMLYAAIIVTAVFQLMLGLSEVILHIDPVWGYRGGARGNPLLTGYARAQGSLGHPILFALLQGVAFIVAWSNPARWKQGWRLLALACAIVGQVIGGTRSVVLALSAAVLVHVAMNTKLLAWARTLYVMAAGGVFLVTVDVGVVRIAQELVVSGSWSHRSGALQSIPDLLARPPLEAWFGYGWGSQRVLYQRGYMHQTYLRVVDNMFVYVLGTMGIAGLLVLLAVCVLAFFSVGRMAKALLALVVGMFFSFDVLLWTYSGLLFSIFITLPKPEDPVTGLKPPDTALVAQPQNVSDSVSSRHSVS
ncbi:O-antigen ligase [Leifsonia sp. TF02-11]|uniref:O-antigen ligase family protein n=1 Tax=Leifsonia sp. TF02-11 TaxID=2815212 RepID=UPI001AA1ACEF|nr:hypothetical protein [Leifsonia sp. TF02-11]MBO1740115.1 hypothetical protein [Leifsonia sp. TF02-11]